MYISLILITGLISNIFPPVGRQYGKTISIPMLGNQEIHSRVMTKNSVGIRLKGIVNLNGTAKYLKSEDPELIVLSYNLRKTLRTLQVDFERPEYDSKRDRVIFRLKIRPLFYSKNIILERETTCV
jgi:hypothetical protein